jgi:hypothetical protein
VACVGLVGQLTPFFCDLLKRTRRQRNESRLLEVCRTRPAGLSARGSVRPSSSPLRCSISSIVGETASDDRTVGQPDKFVDEWRRRLAPAQVRDHRCLRHVGQDELRDPKLLGVGSAEGIARKFLVTGIDPLSLQRNSPFEWLRPIALYEVVSVVEQKKAEVI